MIKLDDLTRLVNGKLKGDPEFLVNSVDAIHKAGPDAISFCVKDSIAGKSIQAGALIVAEGSTIEYPNLVYVSEPYQAFAFLLDYFFPHRRFNEAVSPRAHVEETAVIGENVSVGPFSYVGPNTQIGANSEIHSGVKIYRDVKIGKNCLIYSNVVIREDVTIGDGVVIQPGAVIGSDGFGFTRLSDGTPVKIPQKGKVVIGNNCEIGANTCIDRSTIEETVLSDYVKMDNLVQIGHNVRIGKGTAISALSGISGSSEIGANVIIAGQAGVVDHVKIADEVILAAGAGVSGNIKTKGIVAGRPHQDFDSWKKSQVIIRNLDKYVERIKQLEKTLKELQNHKNDKYTEEK
ncbi:MAG TPA: UDP-3-O-(3-hydroxymyristoyl)glucosamine N-acyltransferase [Candidatus Deferrimicrobium sp.]|nr:UDP-3-O-(3-hydroxymyristoyl)glucosamine N-acyltransferase [Candidatus Deferrimicrobium sp.]